MPKIVPVPSPRNTNFARLFMFKMPLDVPQGRVQMALDSALDAALKKRTAHNSALTDAAKLAYEKLEALAVEHMSGEPLDVFRHHLGVLLDPPQEVEVEEEEAEDESEAEAAENFEDSDEDDDEREDDEDLDENLERVVRAAVTKVLGDRQGRDNRPPGSAPRADHARALAEDNARRARSERSLRHCFPDAGRLDPHNALEVGCDPHWTGSTGYSEGDASSLYDYFPDAARIGRV